MNVKYQQLTTTVASLLQTQQAEAFTRMQQGLEKLKNNFTRKDFFYLFAICPRWFAKQQVDKQAEIYQALSKLDNFGVTESWFYVQFARLYILLAIEAQLSSSDYTAAVNQLFQTADVNELILLVQTLQFIPQADRFVERAREAARSNIESVFCALAHKSDYAYRHFDKSGWNQLILKAGFLAVPIWSIYGLRQRNNPELVTMLLNYVEERQAAKRKLPWDLWACPAWLAASETDFNFLRGQFAKLDTLSGAAIVLALMENEHAEARVLATSLAAESADINMNELNWPHLATLNEKSNDN